MHLYSGPLSLFSRKVEIALAEKGLSFTRTLVPFSQTKGYAPRHEAVQAANPKGQVPDRSLAISRFTIQPSFSNISRTPIRSPPSIRATPRRGPAAVNSNSRPMRCCLNRCES